MYTYARYDNDSNDTRRKKQVANNDNATFDNAFKLSDGSVSVSSSQASNGFTETQKQQLITIVTTTIANTIPPQQQQQTQNNNNMFSQAPNTTSTSSTASGQSITENKVVVTLDSQNRDIIKFPLAENCIVNLPQKFDNISSVSLIACEVPFSAYNIKSPSLYFSEQQNGIWYPFKASLSTGNYNISNFVDSLAASLISATSLTNESASVQNTYSTSFSEEFGTTALYSDHKAPFSICFRAAPVLVSAAKISANGTLLTLTLNDSQVNPLAPGAGCTFSPGNIYNPMQVVVQEILTGTNNINVRIVASIDGYDKVPTTDENGNPAGQAFSPRYKNLASVFGTTTPGQTIVIAQAASLLPFSADSNNLGDLLGFGRLNDRSNMDSTNKSKIKAIQTPFSRPDGAIVVVTEFPHFVNTDDIVRVSGTNSFFDGLHQVTAVLDETHFTFVANTQPFLDSMPKLVIFLNGPNNPPVTIDLVESVELVSALNGTAELLLTLKDKIPQYDVNTFTGKKVVFAVDNAFYGGPFNNEYAQSRAEIGLISTSGTSSFPDKMQFFLKYPTSNLTTTNAFANRVSNGNPDVFDPSELYFNSIILPVNRTDFSTSNRSVYLGLSLNGTKDIGNYLVSAIPNKRIFAKIPLSSGRDQITFSNKDSVASTAKLATRMPSAQSVRMTIFDQLGRPFAFQGSEYSITLEIVCTAPIENS